MKPNTIRGIHSILSGAFAAAQRWEWTDRNPAESAKPPTAIRQIIPATSPEAVAKVIAEARRRNAALSLYLWLVVVTGVRRGELCGLQVRDIHLDQGLVHVAFNYVVRGGQRVRKDTKTHQVDPHRFRRHHPKWHDGLRGENRKWDRPVRSTPRNIRMRLWSW